MHKAGGLNPSRLQAATITDPAAEQAVREQLSQHSRQLSEWEKRVAAQLKTMLQVQRVEHAGVP